MDERITCVRLMRSLLSRRWSDCLLGTFRKNSKIFSTHHFEDEKSQMQSIEENPVAKEQRKTMRRSLKTSIQGFLSGIGLYRRIKYSFLYDFYWGIADRKLIDNRNAEEKL